MADFFTRLAERATGTARIVRPVIAPVFAAPSQKEVVVTTAPARPPAPKLEQQAPISTAARRAPAETPVAPPARRGAVETPIAHRAERTPQRDVIEREPIVTRELIREQPVDNADRDHRREQRDVVPVEREALLMPDLAAQRSVTQVLKEGTPMAREVAKSPVERSPIRVREPQAAEATQPIHISIDRIEVKAIHPPTQAAPARKARTVPQAMPLDEYLKQRSEARR